MTRDARQPKRDRAREIVSYKTEIQIEYALCGSRADWHPYSGRKACMGPMFSIGFGALHHTTSSPLRMHVRKSRARG